MMQDTQGSERKFSITGHGYSFNMAGRIGLTIILFWAVIAIIAPWIIPYPPGKIVDWDYFGPISESYWMGTDYLGRDILSRVLMGARYTVGISLAGVTLACSGGIVLGMIAAVIDQMLHPFDEARFGTGLHVQTNVQVGIIAGAGNR